MERKHHLLNTREISVNDYYIMKYNKISVQRDSRKKLEERIGYFLDKYYKTENGSSRDKIDKEGNQSYESDNTSTRLDKKNIKKKKNNC